MRIFGFIFFYITLCLLDRCSSNNSLSSEQAEYEQRIQEQIIEIRGRETYNVDSSHKTSISRSYAHMRPYFEMRKDAVWGDYVQLSFFQNGRQYYTVNEDEYKLFDSILLTYFSSHKGKKCLCGHIFKDDINKYYRQFLAYKQDEQRYVLVCMFQYIEEISYSKGKDNLIYKVQYHDMWGEIYTHMDTTDYILLKICLEDNSIKEVAKEDFR